MNTDLIYRKEDIEDVKKIANFYNAYQVIKFSDVKEMTSKRKVFEKQLQDLVNIVLPSLVKISDNMDPNTPIGLFLATLVQENFIKEVKFIEVQLNLKELKKMSTLLDLDKRLQVILKVLV